MRSGSDQRSSRRPYNGNRPFQPQRGQGFDSNGPGVRIRGSAHQICERYLTLAREAAIGGDPIAAENLYQHAEHYLRVANTSREGNLSRPPQPTIPAGLLPIERDGGSTATDADTPELGFGDDRPGFI